MMIKPDTSKSVDYKYGIFAFINRKYSSGGRYFTNENIRTWCDKRDVHYKDTDDREDLVNRIKQAGYK